MVLVLDKILRAGEGRILRKLESLAKQVNALEADIKKLSDEQLKSLTSSYKQRVQNGESLDDLLPEAFATVREASLRTLGQRHYDVQLMGGAALHLGNISEMRTGEGKTLVSTLPAYLNALSGKGVHVVTVNDYLAHRDAEWMGRIHRFLGLTVGTISPNMDSADRRDAYLCDITYGTNNEFGFDYLRDNMAWSPADRVQRGYNFAIVDEVDSILIDEARTPLIISGPVDGTNAYYKDFARIVSTMQPGKDYEVDIRKRTVGVLEEGIANLLLLVVTCSMALTPLLAIIGQKFAEKFEKGLGRTPNQIIEYGARDLANHVIIVGFGKVGKMVARVLEAEGINYIALDVNDEWYYGRHERIGDVTMNARGEYTIVKAIIL